MSSIEKLTDGLQAAQSAFDAGRAAERLGQQAIDAGDEQARLVGVEQQLKEENSTFAARLGATVTDYSLSYNVHKMITDPAPKFQPEQDYEEFYWKNRASLEAGLSDEQITHQRSTARSRAELSYIRSQFDTEELKGALLHDQGTMEALGMGALVYLGDPLARLLTSGVYAAPRYRYGVMNGKSTLAARVRAMEAGAIEGTAQAAAVAAITGQPLSVSTVLSYAAFGGALSGLSVRHMQEAPHKAPVEATPAPVEAPPAKVEEPVVAPTPATVQTPAAVAKVVARGGNTDAQAAALNKEAAKLKRTAKKATTSEAAALKAQAKELKAQAKKVQAPKPAEAAVVQEAPAVVAAKTDALPTIIQAPVKEVKETAKAVRAAKAAKAPKISKDEQARKAAYISMGEDKARAYLGQLERMIAERGPMADAAEHSPQLMGNYNTAKRLIDEAFPAPPKDMTTEVHPTEKPEDIADKFIEAAHEADVSVKERAAAKVITDDPEVIAQAIKEAEQELVHESVSTAAAAQAPAPLVPQAITPQPRKKTVAKPKAEDKPQEAAAPTPVEAAKVAEEAEVASRVEDKVAVAAKPRGNAATIPTLASMRKEVEQEVRQLMLRSAEFRDLKPSEFEKQLSLRVAATAEKRLAETKAQQIIEASIINGASTAVVLGDIMAHGQPYQKLLAERLASDASAVGTQLHVLKPTDDVVRVMRSLGAQDELILPARGPLAPMGMAAGAYVPAKKPFILLQSAKRVGGAMTAAGTKASTILHELIHAATMHKLVRASELIAGGKESRDPALVALFHEAKQIMLVAHANAGKAASVGKFAHAMSDIREFVAVGMTDAEMIAFLRGIQMPKTEESLLSKFRALVMRVLGMDDTKEMSNAFERLMAVTDQLMELPAPKKASNAETMFDVAERNQIDLIPDEAEKAIVSHLYGTVVPAWEADFPIDEKRLITIYNKAPKLLSLGMGMLKSKNSLVRSMVGALLETTTGAAGRNNNSPAIQKAMKDNLFVSKGIAQTEVHYSQWLKGRGSWIETTKDHIFHGKLREQWNREVSREMWYRWENNGASHPSTSKFAKDAADKLDAGYGLMGEQQVAHSLEGSENIWLNRKGYMPRIMDAKAWASAPDSLRGHFVDTLARDLAEAWGGDASATALAAEVARRRVEHCLNLAHGFVPIGTLTHTGERSAVQKLIMEALGPDNAELALEYIGKLAKTTPTHTRSRLDMQMFSTFTDEAGKRWEMWELFHTDQSLLYRQYSHRVSGLIGLSYAKINGESMLDQLRYGISRAPEGQRGTPEEQARDLELFDQMVSEFLGRPYGTANQAIDNLNTITASHIFGSAVFPQIGESVQMVMHAGLGTTMKHYLPNAIKFARGIKEGKNSDDPILKAFEDYTGIFGYDYSVAFPYLPMNTVSGLDGGEVGAFTRGVAAMSHAGRFLSGFQASHTSQQKGAAKVAIHLSVNAAKEFMDTGKIHPLVRDMGFDEEMLTRIYKALPAVAKFREGGELYHLDLRDAEQDLVQQWSVAIMRGAGQMIQKTYVGEKGYFHHSSLGRLLTQSRGMSITAMEKQMARQYQSAGAMHFFGNLAAGAIGFALPLHMLRLMINSSGMSEEKQDEYLAHAMSPIGLTRGVMNYMLQLGLMGDIMDGVLTTGGLATMGVTTEDGESLGNKVLTGLGKAGQGTATSAAEAIPSLGYIHKATKGVYGLMNYSEATGYSPDIKAFLGAFPGARIPYVIPAVNALAQEEPEE